MIKLNPEKENPRWTLCRAAFGREPKAWEFTLWNGEQWRRFLEHLGIKRIPGETASTTVFLALGLEEGQNAYDSWLLEQVEKGLTRS